MKYIHSLIILMSCTYVIGAGAYQTSSCTECNKGCVAKGFAEGGSCKGSDALTSPPPITYSQKNGSATYNINKENHSASINSTTGTGSYECTCNGPQTDPLTKTKNSNGSVTINVPATNKTITVSSCEGCTLQCSSWGMIVSSCSAPSMLPGSISSSGTINYSGQKDGGASASGSGGKSYQCVCAP